MAGNYYYVKTDGANDGTATGDEGLFTSQQTGAFSALDSATAAAGTASYYASLTAAMAATTTPDSGDFICFSDIHDYTSVGAGYSWISPYATTPLTFISVSDTAVETYSKGAKESTTGAGNDISNSGMSVVHGMTFQPNDDWRQANKEGTEERLYDCDIILTTNAGLVSAGIDGQSRFWSNVNLSLPNNASGGIFVSSGLYFEWVGGSWTGNDAGDGLLDRLSGGGFAGGGGTLIVKGVDLSAVDGTIMNNVGGSRAGDDLITATFENCALHASVTLANEEMQSSYHNIHFTNCGSTAAEAEYQYAHITYGGNLEDATNIYRNNSTAFPSGQKISLLATTNTLPTQYHPAVFDFPTRYAELSNAASDVMRIYILSSSTLTDADVWFDCIYPDGTNKHISNVLYSVTEAHNPLRTGTTLTTNTEAWTGRTAENRYQIDLDTSGDVGADGIPTLKVHIGIASATIYFCPTLGLS